MTEQPNATQTAAWNGPEGRHWAAHRGTDGVENRELTEALLAAAAVAPDDRVLDVGCGAGETTRLAALRAPRGHALGVDLSRPMLSEARTRASRLGLGNVAFEQGDAQVHPFATGSFDVALSRFGVMFFDDPVAAFANIRRALRPDGRFVFVCPQAVARNDWYTVPLRALIGHPETVALPDSAMFTLADRDRTAGILTEAGFGSVVIEPLEVPMEFGPDAETAAEFYLGSGPVRALLDRLDPGAAREVLIDALRPYEGPQGVRIPAALWLVTAVRGGITPPAAGRRPDGRR